MVILIIYNIFGTNRASGDRMYTSNAYWKGLVGAQLLVKSSGAGSEVFISASSSGIFS